MVHPLEQSLDESTHQRPARRRSSLDNSSLATDTLFRLTLPDSGAEYAPDTGHYSRARQRRLSLNANLTIPTTFLATVTSHKTKMGRNGNTITDLDADLHHSTHSRTTLKRTVSKEQVITLQRSYLDDSKEDYDEDDSSSSSESSLESSDDADTFCDASFQEPANKEYLRKDLGASCYWQSSCNFLHHGNDNDDDSSGFEIQVEIVVEGEHDDFDDDDDQEDIIDNGLE